MIVIVDKRTIVNDGYKSWFDREGVASTGFCPPDFRDWVETAPEADLSAIEAFLLGHCDDRQGKLRMIRNRSHAPVIALNEQQDLGETLDLFAAGIDDVVRKPVHVREILARVAAIRRRLDQEAEQIAVGPVRVYLDGRDPEVGGATLVLPRRERRILEYLVQNNGRRVTKSQIFNAIYGIFDKDVEESVVESHISKLRKKLRHRLGFDPIDSKRFLGYTMQCA